MLNKMEDSQVTLEPKYLSMAALLLLCVFLVCLNRRLQRKYLKGVPGPRQYFLGSWLNLWEIAMAKDAIRVVRSWCAGIQGSLLKLSVGPLEIVLLLTPENIRKIFGSGDINYLHKPKHLINLTRPVPWYDGVGISRGDKWKSRRKLIVSELSYRKLLSYMDPMNDSSKLLVTKLESLFEAGAPEAIEDTLLQATFRTICKIIFGIETDEEYNRFDCEHFVSSVKRYSEILAYRFTYPWLAVDFLFRLHPVSKELRNFYEQSKAFIESLIEDIQETARTGQARKSSLLTDLVTAELPIEAIYEEISNVVFGGFETTGKALNYLLLMLALNPICQERCRKEVDFVIENDCHGGEFSAQSLKEMSYLEQCILETLRMFPSLNVFMRELDASVTLDDNVTLPAGSIVTVVPLVIHMNPTYYPNPERFDPERFSLKGRSNRSTFAYLPFSVGPRACLGTKYAMNELLIMAARILRTFDIFTDEKLEDITFVTSMTITSASPVKLLLKKRCVVG